MSGHLKTGLGFFAVSILPSLFLIAQEAPTKLPVPDANAQSAAAQIIKEVYGDERAAAKTTDQKQALAKKLLGKGQETGNDNAARFVLYMLSTEIATHASDFQTAFQAIEETDKAFQIDALAMKTDVLRKCASTAISIDQHTSVAETAAEISAGAVAKDNFTVAKPLIELAFSQAKKAKDDSLVKRLSERKDEIEAIALAFEAVKAAVATLERTPTDSEANLTVGKYRCFYKGEWEEGVSMLALGSDETLKTLAAKDLKSPISSDEQTKLADEWWHLAEHQTGVAKKQIRARSRYWYGKALPGLSGLAKDKVEKRLESEVAKVTYLTDLEAQDVRVTVGHTAADLTFDGNGPSHNIWGHPPTPRSSSHIAYNTNRRFRELIGKVGIGDNVKGHQVGTPLTFRIVGDGKVLWKSKPIAKAGVSQSFHISMTGIKTFELFVDCPGPYDFCHAIWIDPVLEPIQ